MTISLIRTFLLYMIIILAVRLMGKRQISDLQTSELVVTFLISNIASIPMQNSSIPLFAGLIPIIVLLVCEIVLSNIMLKSCKFRKFICGSPVVIIDHGKIDQKVMKDLRMTTEDLFEQLRQLDVFSLQDIDFAIIETNGQMSIMKKPEKQQVDASMLGLSPPSQELETVIISDGEISDSSLSLCKLSEKWVRGVLNKKHLALKDVFIMTADKNKNFNIIKKEDLK